MEFTFVIEGMPQLRAKAEALATDVRDGARRATYRATAMGERTARQLAPYRSGALQDSIEGTVEHTATGARGTVVADAPHAVFVEHGTRAHTIEARRAKALHWEDEGGEHFAPRVSHPGTEAQPFMKPARIVAEAVLRAEVLREVRAALQRFGGG